MTNVLYYYAVPIAAGAVALVLVLGLVNMMRGGSPNTSQRLMRLRVLLQFVAIVIVMITIWAMGGDASDFCGPLGAGAGRGLQVFFLRRFRLLGLLLRGGDVGSRGLKPRGVRDQRSRRQRESGGDDQGEAHPSSSLIGSGLGIG